MQSDNIILYGHNQRDGTMFGQMDFYKWDAKYWLQNPYIYFDNRYEQSTYVIIASFVTIVQMLVKAFVPALDESLGVFLPLIVVNCIILGRAEMYARKNTPVDSALDGLGMGFGFTGSLFIVGSIREILGTGKWMGITIAPDFLEPMTLFILPAGGFFTLGCVIAIVGKLTGKKPKKISCESSPGRSTCEFAIKEKEESTNGIS